MKLSQYDIQQTYFTQKYIQPNLNTNAKFKDLNDGHRFPNQITSNIANKEKIIRIKFTPDEDEALINLVSRFGKNDWTKISQELSKNCIRKDCNGQIIIRNARQCKDRYMHYLDPEINNAEWTPEEDHLLELRTLMHPRKWKLIKSFFPGRSEIALRNRFNFIHKGHFDTIKPLINDQINNSPIFQKYTPNEIVEQAFNIQKKSNNLSEASKTEQISTNLLTPNKLTFLQKLYHKYNKDPVADIINNNPIPVISHESVKHLVDIVKSEEMKNKIEFVQEEMKELSNLLENRAFLEMISQTPYPINDPGSDYDLFIMDT